MDELNWGFIKLPSSEIRTSGAEIFLLASVVITLVRIRSSGFEIDLEKIEKMFNNTGLSKENYQKT